MPANTSPVFSLMPVVGYAKVTTANVAVDGTGAIELLLTAGEYGMRIDKFRVFAPEANNAGKIRFFLNFGNAWVPWLERTATATSASATVKGWLDEFEPYQGFSVLPPGCKLGVATTVTNNYHVTVEGGQF